MDGIFTHNAPETEYIKPSTTYCILADMIAATIQHGIGNYIITGPGLVADVLDLKCNAKDGRLYILFPPDQEALAKYYVDYRGAQAVESTFNYCYICDDYDHDYAVAIHSTPKRLKPEEMRLTNKDCLLGYDEGDEDRDKDIYLYKPINLDQGSNVEVINNAYIIQKYSQIYLKCYIKLGFTIPMSTYKTVWTQICTKNHNYAHVHDDDELANWIHHLPKEPLTLIR